MKRSKFLAAFLAALPIKAFTKNSGYADHTDKGFKIKAGEGRIHGHIQLKGVNANILDLKISGSDNNGALAVFEQTSMSPKRGTPLHVHHFQDEVFYILEGEYLFLVGEDKYSLMAGDSIFLPKKIPHAWTQVSEKGKVTVTFQPAGKMENFFVTMAALEHEPSKEQIAKVFLDNEMEIVGPPLKED
ncbi:MAG: cupin domain-containing protein [Flavitalea sp.]